jgi:hypothetical protein
MRQKDIERLGAAAYGVCCGSWHPAAVERLTAVLSEIDPYGLLRPGQPVPANLDETQDIPLRDSPRMLRPSRTAWPPGTPRAPRFPKLIGEPDNLLHD